MKLIYLFLLCLPGFFCFSQAGTGAKGPVQVPGAAVDHFVKENPKADATWKTDGPNYKAEFIDPTNGGHARLYDKSGKLVWRDDEMSVYPPAITDYYNKTYPGEGVVVWSRIDSTGSTRYYAWRNSEMVWFDKDGRCTNGKNKVDNKIQMK